MTDFSLKLSAYLDGELDAAEAAKVEDRLANDPGAQAEFDILLVADARAFEQYDAQLSDPVALSLAQQIKSTHLETPSGVHMALPAARARPMWGMVAASLGIFMLGGAGGYLIKSQPTTVVASGWLTDIAEYHAVYASQGRHLVEVSAAESDHIEDWLGSTVGADFTIPDLTQFDLTFEGGRLLVANGTPVAQLMYRQPDGTVIALCLQQNTAPLTSAPQSGMQEFKAQTLNGFDLVSWKTAKASYVVLGPAQQSNIAQIAAVAAREI
jgi:anti-sigma factor RsiW